jgi:nitroreductase
MDLEVVDHLLTTTRSVRKRLDFSRPVEPELIEKCIDIAFQSPTGSNMQGWRVMVITDPEKRKKIAEYYREGFAAYSAPDSPFRQEIPEGDLRASQQDRVIDSATYLADHLHEAPVFVLFLIEGRMEDGPVVAQASMYGSFLPAAWSFMLAARARGLGSAWTTIHIFYEKQVSELLGIPPEFTQGVLLPVAYYTGDDFKPAKRIDPRTLTSWETWGHPRS